MYNTTSIPQIISYVSISQKETDIIDNLIYNFKSTINELEQPVDSFNQIENFNVQNIEKDRKKLKKKNMMLELNISILKKYISTLEEQNQQLIFENNRLIENSNTEKVDK